MSSETRLKRGDGYAVLTLARPDIRNAITGEEMLGEVIAALNDPGAGVLIITGEGSAFSAGGNVKQMAEAGGIFGGTPQEISESYRSTIQQLTRSLLTTDVVTIAAVNGPAVGAGFDLVLGCDLRIGSTEAWFAHTFAELGIVPGDGGAWLLPRVVGWQRAADIALTARRVPADEAVSLDILLETVEPDELLARARALAEQIVAKPSHSVRLTKRLLRHARSMDLDGFLDLSAAFQAMSHAEPAHREALARYLERWKA
ncbi:MAG TPA: enoyl-CoA hydratase-related protein [Acidimicrobiia bacterium]|nr:enoyl-CoA hydratase-related protein [Acidimicrobiia bacterium]